MLLSINVVALFIFFIVLATAIADGLGLLRPSHFGLLLKHNINGSNHRRARQRRRMATDP